MPAGGIAPSGDGASTGEVGPCAIQDICPNLTLNSNLTETHLSITYFTVAQSFLEYCTEHGNDTAVLCAKFQNVWRTETDVMDERDFARFEFKMRFRRIFYIAQHPSSSV